MSAEKNDKCTTRYKNLRGKCIKMHVFQLNNGLTNESLLIIEKSERASLFQPVVAAAAAAFPL